MRSGNALARTRGPQRGLANLDRRGGRRKVTKRATVEARVTFFRLWRNVSPGSTGAARFVTFLPGHHRTAPPAPTAPSSTPIRSLLDAPFRPPERFGRTPRPRRRPIRSLLDAPFRPPERLAGTAPSSTADPFTPRCAVPSPGTLGRNRALVDGRSCSPSTRRFHRDGRSGLTINCPSPASTSEPTSPGLTTMRAHARPRPRRRRRAARSAGAPGVRARCSSCSVGSPGCPAAR